MSIGHVGAVAHPLTLRATSPSSDRRSLAVLPALPSYPCLQGAAALRVSLQQDMLAKAPTMISLRKVLTPLQMARLIVNCWPFYSTMVRR